MPARTLPLEAWQRGQLPPSSPTRRDQPLQNTNDHSDSEGLAPPDATLSLGQYAPINNIIVEERKVLNVVHAPYILAELLVIEVTQKSTV